MASEIMGTKPRPRLRTLAPLWLGAAALLIAPLAWLLHQRAHPWELVLTIPSGLDDSKHSSTFSTAPPMHIALSPRQDRLITARADGSAELWDLNTLQRISVLAGPLPGDNLEQPHHSGAKCLQFSNAGDIFLEHEDRWKIFDGDGRLKRDLKPPENLGRLGPLSPDGTRIAYDIIRPVIFDLESEVLHKIPDFDYINGGSQRFQWFPDSRRLLFNDYLSVSVIDAEKQSIVLQHRDLDLRLPSPMLNPDGFEEDQDRRKWGAAYIDSQLAADNSRIASLYQPSQFSWHGEGPSDAHRFRLYDATTGALLADHILPAHARRLAVSPDQSTVFVLCCPNFTSLVHVYDAHTGTLRHKLHHKLTRSYPPRLTPFPDNRSFVQHNNRTWIVDSRQRLAPVRLLGSPSNTTDVLVTDNASTIITSQLGKTVHVWKKRRDHSRWGALVLWEYHLIHLIAIAAVCGLLIQIGRHTQSNTGQHFPRLFWATVLILGASLGIAIAGYVVDPIVATIYNFDSARSGQQWFFSIAIGLLWLATLTNLMRLRNGWRKFAVFFLALAIILIAGIFIYLAILWSNFPEAPDSAPFTLDSGFRGTISTAMIWCALVPAVITPNLLFCWVLARKQTRLLFTPPPP